MSEHIKPLLQEYVDKELSPPEMERVSLHVAECRGCRTELEDLQSICRAVGSLSKKPLPVGFMQRLERRRKEAPAPSRVGIFPLKATAFAFSAAVVLLVARQKMDDMFPVVLKGAAANMDMTLDQPAPAKTAAKSKADVLAREAAAVQAAAAPAEPEQPHVKLAKAAGAPLGEADQLAAAKAAPRMRAAPAAPAANAAPAPVTNEEIQAAIEAEKKASGMRVLPKEPYDGRAELAEFARVTGSPAALAAVRGAAPINGPTPALMGGGRGLSAQKLEALNDKDSAAVTAGASGLVLVSDDERLAIWRQRGLGATPPSVNYSSERLLLVVANDYRTVVEIAGVVEGPDRVLVTYRLSDLPEGATRRTTAPSYQYRSVAKSDKPVQFQRLP